MGSLLFMSYCLFIYLFWLFKIGSHYIAQADPGSHYVVQAGLTFLEIFPIARTASMSHHTGFHKDLNKRSLLMEGNIETLTLW